MTLLCLRLCPVVEMILLCLPSGCWAGITLLCLSLSPLVFHGMSGCWAEITLLCLSLSPLVSHGMGEFWRQEWIGQKRKLRLPLLFGVEAGVILDVDSIYNR